MLTEECLGSRTDTKSVLQLLISAVSYPCDFGSEALNMVLFLLEKAFGDEHRHTNILVACSLEHTVKDSLDILPDSIAVGTDDHTALDACILYQLCLFADIGIPLSEVLVH